MACASSNYASSDAAPQGKWACAPTSGRSPQDELPAGDLTRGGERCGQCLSPVRYEGHAAIHVGQTAAGVKVFDPYVTQPSPKTVGPRLLRFGGGMRSNNGDDHDVVE